MNGLTTERLRLRRWGERDRPVFHRLNSDETVMRFFPFRRDRAESDAAMDEWNAAFDRHGLELMALDRLADEQTIGMVGLAPTGGDPYPFAPTVEVGWRLLPEAVGHGYATEAAKGCLRHGFETMAVSEIVAYCVVENKASEAVMQRVGLLHAGTFDHPSVDPATHPHLVRHSLYRVARSDWLARQG